MEKRNEILTVIDLSSIFWQMWHATANGEVSAAYEKTINKIYSFATEGKPVAIAVDTKPYKRKEWSPEYKAQRDTPSPLAVDQLRQIIETLENDGFPIMRARGYEADDIIATIANQRNNGGENDIYLHIVTSDKDLLQLVNETVTVESTLTGEQFNSENVFEKFGVYPPQLGELLAMWGDRSDNVPGIPGIGIKTAAKIINGEDISEGIQKKIEHYNEQLKLSRKLVALMNDAPIDVDACFQPRIPNKKPTQTEIDFDDLEDSSETTLDDDDTPENENRVVPITRKNETVKIEPPTSKNQIVKRDQSWSLSLEPISTSNAVKLSKILFESRLYTKFSNPQQILAVMLRGRALGMDSTTALDGFHVIEGKPSLSAPLIEGLVIQSPLCDYFECTESTNESATYITHRRGSYNPDPVSYTFTFEDAERAGLTGTTKNGMLTNWHKRPRVMLRHRCATELARMVYPDIVAGLYTPDEISEGEVIECEIVNG